MLLNHLVFVFARKLRPRSQLVYRFRKVAFPKTATDKRKQAFIVAVEHKIDIIVLLLGLLFLEVRTIPTHEHVLICEPAKRLMTVSTAILFNGKTFKCLKGLERKKTARRRLKGCFRRFALIATAFLGAKISPMFSPKFPGGEKS